MRYTEEQAKQVLLDSNEFMGIGRKLHVEDKRFLNHEFPKPEVGKWYKDNEYADHIFCLTKLDEDKYYFYGFDSSGEWMDEEWYDGLDAVPATDKEVEEALKAEAKRRGYKEGVVIDNSNLGHTEVPWTLSKSSWYNGREFVFCNGGLVYANSATIFKDGKWAEIIEDPKEVELTLDEVAEKFGVDVKHLKIKK